MKASAAILKRLKDRIGSEYQAISQYRNEGECCRNADYNKLAEYFDHQVEDETGHVKRLLARLYFLEGVPDNSIPNSAQVADFDIESFLKDDLKAETEASDTYTKFALECWDEEDVVTAILFQQLAADEQEHMDELTAMLDQIEAMGLENFLQAKM